MQNRIFVIEQERIDQAGVWDPVPGTMAFDKDEATDYFLMAFGKNLEMEFRIAQYTRVEEREATRAAS